MGIISRIVDWVSTPYTIILIVKDKTIACRVKVSAIIGLVLIFVYVISPFDIVPDVVPFAGWLDDLIVVPLGFALLRRFTPGFDVAEHQNRAQRSVRRILLWVILALTAGILLFLTFLVLLIFFIVKWLTG